MRKAISILSGILLVGACGGGGASSPPPTAPTSEPEPAGEPAPSPPAPGAESDLSASDAPAPDGEVVGPPDVKWADMDDTQKAKFMKAVVLPKMKELFQEFDAEEFASFDCTTCHGDDAKERHFEMPNPGLPELPADAAGFQKLMKDEPKWVEFMSGKVKPEMAKLLGLPEMDPKDPRPGTFGCGNCHTMAGK